MNKSNRQDRPKGGPPPKKHRHNKQLRQDKKAPPPPSKGAPYLYGRHCVIAALANPARACQRLLVTEDFLNAHGDEIEDACAHSQRKRPAPEIMTRQDLDDLLSQSETSVVHQGIAVQCAPLAHMNLEDLLKDCAEDERALLVALDQATDPQNIGAVLRSAAAFGASAVLIPERNAPDITPSLAKAACGALERLPLIRITNLTRSLKTLQENHFWSVGLDGYAEQNLGEVDLCGRIVLVMGSEGSGLRRLTRETCDFLAKIPISAAMESLNLSNATAISLYECARQRHK